jgi:hypothetical protein
LLFFARIFRPLLPGAAPFGDLPDSVNTSGIIEGFFCYGFYPSPNKPLQDGRGLYIQNLGNLGYGQSFHIYSIAYNLKKINSFEQQVIDKLVIYNYYVFIASHSKAWQREGYRNMAKIINFLEAWERLEMAGLASALKALKEREEAPEKEPVFISALPGEAIPPEYPDFRPILQRDGLILLGWTLWELPELGVGYEVNWITSIPKHRRYRSSFIKGPMRGVQPDWVGNQFFREGLWEGYNKIPAEYVVFCAPPDINPWNIPAFVQLLKNTGVTVDFDYRFSLGGQQELEFKREQAELAARLENIARDGGLA